MDNKQNNEKRWWQRLVSRINPSHSLVTIETDIRNLMRRCGELSKQLEECQQDRDEHQRSLLLEFIPVADALETLTRELLDANVLSERQTKEMEMLGRRFTRAFERSGVTRIPIQPRETMLDANCHEVVRTEFCPSLSDDTILHVIKPGYVQAGRVLRPAQVIVANTNT